MHRIFEILLGEHPSPSWTEKPAENQTLQGTSPPVPESSAISHSTPGSQQAQQSKPDKTVQKWQQHYERQVKLAYEKEAAKQKARTDGERERLQLKLRGIKRMSNEEYLDYAKRINTPAGGANTWDN